MSGAALGEFKAKVRQDGRFLYSFSLKGKDGSAFPWSAYTFSYRLSRDGAAQSIDATIGIDPAMGVYWADFRPASLCPGRYDHVLIATETATGDPLPLWDGTLTIVGVHRS